MTSILILPKHLTTRSSPTTPWMHHSSPLRVPQDHPNHIWWLKMSIINTQTTSVFTNDRPACITDWQQQKLHHEQGTVWNWRKAMALDEYYKDKVAHLHFMKAKGVAEVQLHWFLTSELYTVQQSSGRERTPVRIQQEVWWNLRAGLAFSEKINISCASRDSNPGPSSNQLSDVSEKQS
jgi:hypothetical protein